MRLRVVWGLASVIGAACAAPSGEPARIVPAELADVSALAALASWASLPVLAGATYHEYSSYDRGGGLEDVDPYLRELLGDGNRDMNHFVCASPDAQAEAQTLIPYRFDRESCDADVTGFVLADVTGSGHMVRFWLTSVSMLGESLPDDEVLRIYVDGDPTPRLKVPLREMLTGEAGEMFQRPFETGTQDHLAWYYPVSFSSHLTVTLDGLGLNDAYYYQVGVVTDAQPHDAPSQPLAERSGVRETLGGNLVTPDASMFPEQSVELEAGASKVIAELEGPATLHRLVASSRHTDRLDDVWIEIRWDGASAPAIDVPLGELVGPVATEASLALAPGTLQLPMPFAHGARIRLRNEGEESVELNVAAYGDSWLPGGAWGHLHVLRSETVPPVREPVHPVVRVVGPGRLVGTCLLLEARDTQRSEKPEGPMRFLEGDLTGSIDGEAALHGTGTEDFLDGAFYFRSGPFATPFAQVWSVDQDLSADPPEAWMKGCRWTVLSNAIEFSDDLELSLEVGIQDETVLGRYRSLAFVYLSP